MLEGGERNLVERSVNQEDQKGLVEERSVRQVYVSGLSGLLGECVRSGGTETRAEVVLRMVRERVCQSMALGMEGKEVGRVSRKDSIDERPSMADPSTTSSTMKPRRDGGGAVEARWVITAPPRECPMRRIGGGLDHESLVAVAVRTKRRSVARVGSVRSRDVDGLEVVGPWARASIERMPAVGRTLDSDWKKAANERPDEPAPWWVTIRGPLEDGGLR